MLVCVCLSLLRILKYRCGSREEGGSERGSKVSECVCQGLVSVCVTCILRSNLQTATLSEQIVLKINVASFVMCVQRQGCAGCAESSWRVLLSGAFFSDPKTVSHSCQLSGGVLTLGVSSGRGELSSGPS